MIQLTPAALASMPTDPAGLAAAVEAVADPAAEAAAHAAEQADLFAGSPLLGGARGAALMPAVTRGRPPGAQNESTKAWKSFILRHFRSPLLGMAELQALDPFALTEAIRAADQAAGVEREVSVMDVLSLQRAARADLAPYVHRRQPLAIDGGEDKSLPSITFVQVAGAGGEVLAAQGLQVLGPLAVDGEVAGEKSHGQGNEG